MGTRAVFFAIGAVNFLIVLIISGSLFTYRTTKLIKASQPGMMCFILLGGAIGSIRVINTGLDITDSSCISGLWLGHLSFVLVFGGLLIKTWRVNRIINSISLKRVKITASDVFKMMLVVLAFAVIYMSLLTWVGLPHQSALTIEKSNHATRYLRCTFVYSQFHSALFALEAFILLYGAMSVQYMTNITFIYLIYIVTIFRLCWKTKNVPDAVNESKFIAFGKKSLSSSFLEILYVMVYIEILAMGIIVLISSLVFPIVLLIGLMPTLQQIITTIAIFIANIAAIVIMFSPKILTLREGGDVDGDMKIKKKPGTKISKVLTHTIY
jgi:hypothetical protein